MTAPVLAGTPEPETISTTQALTAEELQQARVFLEQTQNLVVGVTKGLSGLQWKFKPAADRWSIAENLDHIVIVQERVLGPILEQLATAPPPPAGFNRKSVDAIVIHQFPSRLMKFTAPEFVRPMDQIDPIELLNRLIANYSRLSDFLESKPGLRQHATEAPPMKVVSKGVFEVMDGYQWILAAAAHAERHAKQMLEVKANAAYPA